MDNIIVLTRGQLDDIICKSVDKAVEKIRPMLIKASNEYITKEEVSMRFSIPKRTLDEWRRKGTGPSYYEKGKLLLYRVDDIIKYLDCFMVNQESN